MQNIVKKCLIHCDQLKASSIAFPAVGAGNLKYPINVVSKVMITSVVNYLKSNHGTTHINQVKMVIYMESDFQEFQKVFNSLQSNHGSQMVSSPNNAGVVASPVNSLTPNKTITSSTLYQPNIIKTFIQEGLSVEIVLGDITDDDSDAIVNPTNKKMDLAAGAVSAAILKKGGPEMQVICDSVMLDGHSLNKGKVYVTTVSGSLRCKKIFHVVLNSSNLGDTISACLEQAETDQLALIAFPALGTGASGYTVELAADIMHVAVAKFAMLDPTHLKTVRVILYQQSMVSCYANAFAQPDDAVSPVHQVQEVTGLKSRPSLIARARTMMTSHLFGGTKMTKSSFSSVKIPAVTKYSEMIVEVFADDIEKVENTEAFLQRLIEEQLITDVVDDMLVCKLTAGQQADIEQKAKTRNVKITMELGKLQHKIQLTGDSKDVTELKTEIDAILHEISTEELKLKDILSVQAKVKWQWENTSGGPVDYDPVANYAIEQAYQSDKTKLYVYQNAEEFDFRKMKAKDLKDQSVYNIKRLDVDYCENCFVYVLNCTMKTCFNYYFKQFVSYQGLNLCV